MLRILFLCTAVVAGCAPTKCVCSCAPQHAGQVNVTGLPPGAMPSVSLDSAHAPISIVTAGAPSAEVVAFYRRESTKWCGEKKERGMTIAIPCAAAPTPKARSK